jgi:hypothetical protein
MPQQNEFRPTGAALGSHRADRYAESRPSYGAATLNHGMVQPQELPRYEATTGRHGLHPQEPPPTYRGLSASHACLLRPSFPSISVYLKLTHLKAWARTGFLIRIQTVGNTKS